MSEEQDRQLAYRVRVLPDQLTRARLRLRQLENEAKRLGLRELLEDPATYDRAWEREMEIAKLPQAAPAADLKSAA